jgi:hypothetical protein
MVVDVQWRRPIPCSTAPSPRPAPGQLGCEVQGDHEEEPGWHAGASLDGVKPRQSLASATMAKLREAWNGVVTLLLLSLSPDLIPSGAWHRKPQLPRARRRRRPPVAGEATGLRTEVNNVLHISPSFGSRLLIATRFRVFCEKAESSFCTCPLNRIAIPMRRFYHKFYPECFQKSP